MRRPPPRARRARRRPRRRPPRSRRRPARAAAASTCSSIRTREKGALEIFDWQGYEDASGPFWTHYTEGAYGKSNPLKFTFLENDQQALAKVASGFKTDVTHPCLAYTRNWLDADLIQPWDVDEIPGFDTINPRLYEASVFEDKVYGIPWDWGYVSLVYRADKVDPKEMSWNLLLDERYKGRIGFFTDGVDIIQVGGLINGVSDPNTMSSEEIEAAKQTMLKAKKNIRTFWTNQTEAVAGDGRGQPRHHVRLAGRLVQRQGAAAERGRAVPRSRRGAPRVGVRLRADEGHAARRAWRTSSSRPSRRRRTRWR